MLKIRIHVLISEFSFIQEFPRKEKESWHLKRLRLQQLEEAIQTKRCKQRDLMNELMQMQHRETEGYSDVWSLVLRVREIIHGKSFIVNWMRELEDDKKRKIIKEALELCTEREQLIEEAKRWGGERNIAKEAMQIREDRELIIKEEPLEDIEHKKVNLTQLVEFFIRLVLLAILFGNAAKLKDLTRPRKNRICCVKVFLLSNEGAHAYNGNGTCLTKHRRAERIVVYNIYYNTRHNEVTAKLLDACTQCDVNDVNESSDNPNLSVDTLQRRPSDKEIGTIALSIGPEWHQLGLQLGLLETELYHIKEDHRGNSVQRNSAMLFKWRGNRENSATFEELRNACIRAKVNPGDIFKNIEEA
ncbi:uncharacterized protein LOC128554337 [Mercenaria mercenaria]|uniref:uncharacterized protein LOC128554337 n=1 Tax=Mercenaria mercenaria TaxID=6596 RepID=UPI00234ECDFE|nr:uncharacterized protein LOC128554337 [Mercenaria mercenaria]